MGDKNRRSRRILIMVIVLLLLLLALLLCRACSGTSDELSLGTRPTGEFPSESSPSKATSQDTAELVGRWDGSSPALDDFTIVIGKIAPAPDVAEETQYVSGYVVFGDDSFADPVAPLSGVATSSGEGRYQVQIWSTDLREAGETAREEENHSLPILFTGSMDASQGEAAGQWQSGEEVGEWRGRYQGEHVPEAQPLDGDTPGLRLVYDLMAAIQTSDQNGSKAGQQTAFDVYTNIAASSVLVQKPDGSEITLVPMTDIFTPEVDFVSEFRFAANLHEATAPGEYIFHLLDPMGEPMAGLEGVDVWSGCDALAPLNVQLSVESDGLLASWNSVPGFDPSDPDGFYQIGFGPVSGEGKDYGANHIQGSSHLLPFASFSPGSPGSPDGRDFGVGLGELPDGSYQMVIYVFFSADETAGGTQFECQLTALDEVVLVEKNGANFRIEKP